MGIRIDIKEKDLKILLALLQQFLPNTLVWAFGSRAKFTAKPTSDLDLVAFINEEQKMNFSLLRDALAESNIPFRVDLHDWNDIPENFRNNIEGNFVVIQSKDDVKLPSNWKTYKLGDLGFFFGGITTIKQEDYGFGTPFLTYKNVYKNSKVNVNELELMNVRPQDVERRSAIYGDIFFTASSETPDEVAMSSILLDNVENLTFNGFCKRFRLNDFKTLLPEYARYLFRDISFRREVYQVATGDIRFNISQESLAKIEINIPDVPTQTKIAQTLTSLDDKIELNLQMNQTLEAMAQAMFKEWFVDFKFPEFDGLLVNGLPKGWKKIQIKDICDVNSKTLNAKDKIDEIHYIEISEVEKGIIKNISVYKRGEEPSRAKRKLKHGDTVLSTVRPNRGSYFLSFYPSNNLIASTGFAVFSPKEVPFSFLYTFLTNDEQLEFYGKMADGAAYPAINQSVIMNMEISLPTKDLLDLFHSVAGYLLIKLFENLEENKIFVKTRDALIPKLMSGKIEIKH